jgi:hypothetical protein
MSVDVLFSYLVDATFFFLGSWVVLLVTAGVAAFSPIDATEGLRDNAVRSLRPPRK